MRNGCVETGLMSSPTLKMAPAWTPLPAGSSASCSSNLSRVGRDGYLALEFERRPHQTILTRCRFRLPLQALKPSYIGGDGSAFMLLLNPGGGLVGGDRL